MAKVTGPILSLGARGQIAKAVVFGVWKGVSYARQHVVPANPDTVGQQSTRNAFSGLSLFWKKLGAIAREPWVAASEGQPLTDRNAIIRSNLPVLRGELDSQLFIGSPGARGGLAPVAVVAAATAVAGEIEITITSPPDPSGFTLFAAQAVAFDDDTPENLGVLAPSDGQNLAPVVDGDTIITLVGQTSGVVHVVSGWLRYTRADGRTAYGPSITTTATPL